MHLGAPSEQRGIDTPVVQSGQWPEFTTDGSCLAGGLICRMPAYRTQFSHPDASAPFGTRFA